MISEVCSKPNILIHVFIPKVQGGNMKHFKNVKYILSSLVKKLDFNKHLLYYCIKCSFSFLINFLDHINLLRTNA